MHVENQYATEAHHSGLSRQQRCEQLQLLYLANN